MLNSRLRPDLVWSATCGTSFVLWTLLPQFRPALSLLLVLHFGALIIGIADLKTGFFCSVYCRCPAEQHRCVLTFDDGPDPRLTPAILDLLEEFNFSATFFCIARAVREHPALTREIIKRGHEVGCHDLHHTVFSNFRRYKRMVEDISSANTIIADVTGKYPRLYRPPVGLSNPHLRTALSQLGMSCIGWNRSIGDAGNRLAGKFPCMPDLAQPGSIILLHDCLPNPAYRDLFLQNLRMLFAAMKKQGLTGCAVSTLFKIPPYRRKET